MTRTRAWVLWQLALVIALPAAHGAESLERRAGCYIDQYMVNREVVLFAPALEERVARIVEKISAANSFSQPFQVRILNSPVMNAYAAPGGFIYVTSGLLEFVANDDELAAFIAHEMAHVIQHHYFQEVQAFQKKADHLQLFLEVGSSLVGVGAGLAVGPVARPNVSDLLLQRGRLYALNFTGDFALGFAGGVVLLLDVAGYSQDRELEADALAPRYAANAGYNPRALIAALKRLALLETRAQNARDPQFVSHLVNAKPGLKSRIELLRKALCGQDNHESPCI
jgi:predicted Zn-dependent protease